MRLSTLTFKALVLCMPLAVLLLPGLAQAQAPGAVRSLATGQCMDVFEARQTAEAGVVQFTCTGAANQQWQLVAEGGFYSLRAGHSGLCLDVFRAGTAPGTPLIQWPCAGAVNQQFSIRAQGSGFALVARNSNLCVGVEGGAAGGLRARLTQQVCNGSAAQTFSVPLNTGALQAVGSNQCVDVDRGSLLVDARVIQWPCSGTANQQWQAVQVGGFNTFMSASSGLCLDVFQGGTAPGTPVVQWNCQGSANQQFTLRAQGAGQAVVARHSGLCLAIAGNSQAPDTQLVQQVCDGSPAQTWRRLATSGDVAVVGRWGPVQNLPLVPAAAANLPDGRVLFWSAYDRFGFGGDNGRTYTSVYNPATGAATDTLVSNTGHDMFCPGIANLPDGRIHVTGGSSASRTSIYNPATGAWAAARPMNVARGYQGAVTLANGDVFTIGGSWSGGVGNKDGEVWSAATGTWRRTTGIWDDFMLTGDVGGVYRSDNHAWLFAASGGRIFHAGPSWRMNWFNPSGAGTVAAAGFRAADGDAMNGNAVMFDINRILTVGGARNYENTDATGNAHLIDIGGAAVTVRALPRMAYARAYHNSVVLPDGKVAVIGGQTFPRPFSDDRAVLVPELFNPVTQTFTTVAPMAQPRTYHSVALLLPDGRVLSGGGGLCGGCTTNHPNVQVWSPPYLFNRDGSEAARPVLTAAPAQAAAGTRVAVSTNAAVTAFSLVRLSSVTHSVNNEQRRVPVSFTTTAANQYSLALPADKGVLVPGFYMLFAINANGVPSVARMIRVL